MTVHSRLPKSVVDQLRTALTSSALPGETEGLDRTKLREAAEFVADAAASRPAGTTAIDIESTGGEAGRRRMRLVTVNEDMPFLVDSVTGAIAARGLAVHRLLHPIVNIERDADGELLAVGEGSPESVIYIELDRADARGRQDLVRELKDVLSDVRAAVRDWKPMLAQMRSDAECLAGRDAEGAALLGWLADNNFTLLGQAHLKSNGEVREAQGILKREMALWERGAAEAAIDHLGDESRTVLILKADRISPVHRRVPLDVVMVRLADGSLSVHVGLWTSAALRTSADEVPVLRTRLESLDREFGFAPSGHAAKALAHTISTLPHDLLISFNEEEVRAVALTAMGLADRPRPKLLLLPGALHRHIYAFVWLPRDELSTARRRAIARMLELEIEAPITSWSLELGEGELALLRFTLPVDPGAQLPDTEALDEALLEMVRGWAPAVEAELVNVAGAHRATRLALTYLPALPDGYRGRTSPEDAAVDVLRLADLNSADERSVRLAKVGDSGSQLQLKTYRRGQLIPLSDAVPVLENFGFRVLEEMPTSLGGGTIGYIHDFRLELPGVDSVDTILKRASVIEQAIACVLSGAAENDEFNQLVVLAGLDPSAVVWLRAWFRYLRQTGSSFGLLTVVDALRRAPAATDALVALFGALHDPSVKKRDSEVARLRSAFDHALGQVRSIDDDRILRRLRALVEAVVRTNAFAPAAEEALAFKLNSSLVPGLPAPVPWREIWVYSPRIEGIHLRGGPVARGGLRWSDRRDDFRTEILGLMKAQLVKNAVIVPTGAKGGFYPKLLPPPSDRDAWIAEGTESYRIFIRSLLSVTDNIVDDKVVHPEQVVIHDGDDPYFVVAADKGTATFSDVANGIALERGFWLGDAFASGGSNGYDHKAMGITARGAWISVQRHFLEMGTDVQTDPIRVIGVGDMSGDVFGNGMLLSKAIKLVAAFDHRHIFIDPDPDPAASWAERQRLFDLPRSSWDDYDRSKISRGGGVFPRTQKEISLSKEAQAALGIETATIDPASLMNLILRSQVDLLWFGGIGTYVKSSDQLHSEVGDPANDAIRADANQLRVRVIGEGANLGITQAARIEFSEHGGRINTDFIDNSAGVDCSDKEVNIKIPLNREMREGRLTEAKRNTLLARMTDDVAEMVLEDNRLQALALSIAESAGINGLPGHVRTIELLEASGRLDRKVEGLLSSEELLRRGQDNRGMTRPELAVVLSMSKMALQDAIEELDLADDKLLEPELFAAFPKPMRSAHANAIRAHRLRNEIIATRVANRLVNRLGPGVALDLTEEEGASLGQVASAFLVAERLLDLDTLWGQIETAEVPETVRVELFTIAARSVRAHMSDILRATSADASVSALCKLLEPGVRKISAAATKLIRAEVRNEAVARRERLIALGASEDIVKGLVRLFELDGMFGIVALAARRKVDELSLTRAYTMLGEALGIDWAQQQVARFTPSDQWERLLTAGLARDFEQLRIEFLSRVRSKEPHVAVENWVEAQMPRIEQFRQLIARARHEGSVSASMLAQIASQARILLAR
ncbi:NAD-glutamate dehydrogenase [Sphingomonas sinipercae]|uniref:NAD-glutamate dehydrogenase n=1 Tax=Sphingomonas sinipercae TaxID=2714944 RepID=A0A6G7ZLG0_9SPHN|nr:NAD-glutamate dehydrogenase domain-containing protein [Sphingomonas sinipercae]QIL01773.1 NAD-glutamate dehydrogenase [Sphingomonas sinipercae]